MPLIDGFIIHDKPNYHLDLLIYFERASPWHAHVLSGIPVLVPIIVSNDPPTASACAVKQRSMTRRNAGRKVIDELFLRLLGLGWSVAGFLAATEPGGTYLAVVCFLTAVLNLHALTLCRKPGTYATHARFFSSNLRVFEALLLTVGSSLAMFRGERLWLLVVPVVLADSLVERTIRRSTLMAVAVGLVCGLSEGLEFELVDVLADATLLVAADCAVCRGAHLLQRKRRALGFAQPTHEHPDVHGFHGCREGHR